MTTAETKAQSLCQQMTTEQLFNSLEILGQPATPEAVTTWAWIRGELIDRSICPDCRTTLNEDIMCEGCN